MAVTIMLMMVGIARRMTSRETGISVISRYLASNAKSSSFPYWLEFKKEGVNVSELRLCFRSR